MKSFGVMRFIILLDKSTVIKDGLIGSPLNEMSFLFEFTVPILRFYVFETFLNSAPRLGSVQEPKETHLELASFDSALPGDFPFTCFNWCRNGPSRVHQDNHELWKLRKRGGLLWPIAREETDLSSLHSTAFLPYLCNLVKKSDFIKTKISSNKLRKNFS